MDSALYIVPTPIGNLEDITLRAVKVLRAATLIAAEDTRHSRILLDHLGITGARLISCHDHNERERAGILVSEVERGGVVAVISDAGTPLINDPGYRAAALCAAAGVRIVPLPGPCALVTALEGAALPTDRFMFGGFFPVRERELERTLLSLSGAGYTAVFYESPKRILATMRAAARLLPERSVAVCRELTKAHEAIYRMRAAQFPAFLEADPDRRRGEFVVVIGPDSRDGAEAEPGPALAEALRLLLPTSPVKSACQALALASGVKRNRLYELALKLK